MLQEDYPAKLTTTSTQLYRSKPTVEYVKLGESEGSEAKPSVKWQFVDGW